MNYQRWSRRASAVVATRWTGYDEMGTTIRRAGERRDPVVGSRARWWTSLCLPALLAVAAPAAAQVVAGRVVEADEGGPAEGIVVQLTDLEGAGVAVDVTDATGAFSLEAPQPGMFFVRASGSGYRPVRGGVFELGFESRIEIEIRLTLDPLELDEVEVEVDDVQSLDQMHPLVVNGFAERAESGRGRFLTPRDLERSRHLDLPRILQRTGRVEIVNGLRGRTVAMRRPGGLCDPVFFIDDRRAPGTEAWIGLNQQDLLAIEVYRSAVEAPVEYRRFGVDCGVILVWTHTAATARRPGIGG